MDRYSSFSELRVGGWFTFDPIQRWPLYVKTAGRAYKDTFSGEERICDSLSVTVLEVAPVMEAL